MAKNYDPLYIKKYYDDQGMNEWTRLVSAPAEEIKLHMHNYYLKKHLKKGFKVFEIGAGPGRFTRLLDEIGCRVTVADISPGQLELNRKHAKRYGFERCVTEWVEADVSGMKHIKSNTFDAVLAYGGPFSYVFEKRHAAVKECKRVLKRGGLLISSSMSLFGTIHRYLEMVMGYPYYKNRRIIDRGDLTPEIFPKDRHFCHMYRAKEYRELFVGNGLRVLDMSASNSLSTGYDELAARLKKNRRKWNELLEFELEACAAEGYIDAGTHIIAVAKKKV